MAIRNMADYAAEQKKRGRRIRAGTGKRAMQAFSPYKGWIVLVFLAIALTALIGLVSPLVIRIIVDDAIVKHNLGLLIVCALILVAVPIATGLVNIGQTYLSNVVGQRVIRDLRDQLYRHLQRMPLNFFASTRTGEIQSRLSNDVSGVQGVVTNTITQILANLAILASTIIAMLFLSPFLTLVTLAIVPLLVLITQRVANVGRNIQRKSQESLASLTVLLQETLSVSGILLMKTFGRQQWAHSRFTVENEQLSQLEIRRQMVLSLFMLLVNVLLAFTPSLAYLVGGWMIITVPFHTDITLGSVVAFTTLQMRLLPAIAQLLSSQAQVLGSLALFERIFEYLDLPVEIQDAPDALHLQIADVKGQIVLQDISFSYANKNTYGDKIVHNEDKGGKAELASPPGSTLADISFEIKPGQLAALVGPSGAGKTTLTYLIPRLYESDTGAIEIDGHNIKEITLNSLSALIGVVTQETYLFHASVRDNILYGRPDATEEEMVAAARAAAIHERIVELENGYDTMVGERGYKLSGGEKQRIAIARVLLKNPRILILDEATSSLDTQSERLIQAALEPLMKNRTTIAIAHRLSTILAADIILVLKEGRIVERGTHQELLALDGLYTQLYNAQFVSTQIEEEMVNDQV